MPRSWSIISYTLHSQFSISAPLSIHLVQTNLVIIHSQLSISAPLSLHLVWTNWIKNTSDAFRHKHISGQSKLVTLLEDLGSDYLMVWTNTSLDGELKDLFLWSPIVNAASILVLIVHIRQTGLISPSFIFWLQIETTNFPLWNFGWRTMKDERNISGLCNNLNLLSPLTLNFHHHISLKILYLIFWILSEFFPMILKLVTFILFQFHKPWEVPYTTFT